MNAAKTYTKRLRAPNYPLYVGLLLSAVVLIVAIFGPLLAPHDPLKEHGIIWINGVLYGPPPNGRALPPFVDARFPLGTDQTMRDVLSRLLWAVRPTLIMCVVIMLVRLVVGVVLGVLAGWFGGVAERGVDTATSVCTAVPLLAFAVAVLLGWGLQRGLLGFVVALSLTGWCDTASVVKTRVQMIRRAPYIESAQAVGLRTGGILRRHVVPQLRPFLPILVAFELSAVLLVVAELGYLGYYLGGGTVFEYSIGNFDRNFILRSGTPELGQMLSNFFRNFYRTPWIAIAAGGTVFTMLAAFALVSEGLRRKLDITRPRRARWRLPDPLLDRVSLPQVRWGAAGVAAGALLLGAAFMLRPASSVEAVMPTPSPLAVSDVPVAAEQLRAIDLDALVRTPAAVPEDWEVFQVTQRVPDEFRAVPPATNTASVTLKRIGFIQGRFVVLLYPDAAQRDAAYQTIADVVLRSLPSDPNRVFNDPQPVAGTRSTSFDRFQMNGPQEGVPFLEPQIVWERCNAVVHLRASGVDLAQYARMLDAQLAPQVCQPGQPSAGAAQGQPGPPTSAEPTFGTVPVSADQLAAIDLDAFIRQPGIVPDTYEVFQVTGRVRDQFRDVPKPIKAASIGLKRQGIIVGRVQVLLYPDVAQRDEATQTLTAAVTGRNRYPDMIAAELPDAVPVVGERSFSFSGIRGPSSFLVSPDPQVVFVRCGAAVWVQLGVSNQPGLNEGNHSVGAVGLADVVAMAQALDQQLTPLVCQPEAAPTAQPSALKAISSGTAPAAAEQLVSIDFDALIRQPGMVPDNYEVSQVTGRVRDQFRDVPKPIKAASISLKWQGVIAGRVQILLYPDVAQRDAAMQTMKDVALNIRSPEIIPPPPDPVPVAGERSISLHGPRDISTFFVAPDPQVMFVRCGAAVWLQLGESGRSGLDDISTRSGLDQVTLMEVAAMAQVLDQQLAPLVCQP